jgi:hypothetical protein
LKEGTEESSAGGGGRCIKKGAQLTCHHSRVAAVVLGNVCLHFADHVSADVGSLGVDAA